MIMLRQAHQSGFFLAYHTVPRVTIAGPFRSPSCSSSPPRMMAVPLWEWEWEYDMFFCLLFLFLFLLRCLDHGSHPTRAAPRISHTSMATADAFSSPPPSSPRTTAAPRRQWKYDVFLSFRGAEGTRSRFRNYLYKALCFHAMNVFMDDRMLIQQGNSITPALESAIEESRIAIVVLSPNFASSTWCLRELVKILRTRETKGQVVRPVFLDVDPGELRKQTGFFAEIVAKHEECFGSKTAKQWKEVIGEVANLAGWHLDSSREFEVIQEIVEVVSGILHHPYMDVARHPVGLDKHVQATRMLLDTDDARHMVGIWGIGGIGKTTIAKALYNMMADQFEGSSFLANVREISRRCGLHKLQETLLQDILGDKAIRIGYVQNGVNLIRQKLCDKRVMLVLDDVDSLEQLKGLVGEKSWFGSGSRVIITSRDERLLVAHDAKIYRVAELSCDDALQLFSWSAFQKPSPAREFEAMSLVFTRYARGLPLALIVLGSSLCGKGALEWSHALDRMKAVPEGKIDQILKISYLGLEVNMRELFLDIACFFKGQDKEKVTKRLLYCNSYPESGLEILAKKSLIYIETNKIWMHDLVQQMGKEIVRLESPKYPGKRSRLWSHADVWKVIRENLWTDDIQGIKLDMFEPEDMLMAFKVMKKMKRLRLLIIHDAVIYKCPQHRFNQTEWLIAHGNLFSGISESRDPVKMAGEFNSIENGGNGKDHGWIRKMISNINCRTALSKYGDIVYAEPSKLGQLFSLQLDHKEHYLYACNRARELWGFRAFSEAELLRATDNFSNDHLIGHGANSSVYWGVLDDGKEVAIKKAKFPEKCNNNEDQAFTAEIRAGYLKHKNLVQLFGFHEGENERALVFEYMKNGSLYAHLHTLQSSALRSWNLRLRVALEVARALEFLHGYADPKMVHRSLKLSNILLDDNWGAKVSDFKNSVLVSESENVVPSGAVGYVDTTSFLNVNYRLTTKADVYSYGLVLLELLFGHKAAKIVKEERQIVTVNDAFVPFIREGAISQFLDPNMPELRPFEIVAVEDVAHLACLCVQVNPEDRPSMTHVADRLKKDLALSDTLLCHQIEPTLDYSKKNCEVKLQGKVRQCEEKRVAADEEVNCNIGLNGKTAVALMSDRLPHSKMKADLSEVRSQIVVTPILKI